jgi:hypothetical protein
MSFIAPNTDKEIELLFEVKMILGSKVQTKKIKVIVKPLQKPQDSNTTNTTPNTLVSIKLTVAKNSLNLDSNTTLKAVAAYADKTTKDVTDRVEWINTDSNAVQINNHHLQAKKETNIILQAKLNAVTSNAVALEIYREINGHRLPPQPNRALNDSTLHGIDANNNGVRDDVERKIYFTYKRPIEQAFMMQDAKLYPKTLEDPVAAAASEELEKEHWNTEACDGYLILQGIKIKGSVDFMEESYFNTKERMRAYIEFNEASSGGVYHIPLPRDCKESNCDFNVTKMLGLE